MTTERKKTDIDRMNEALAALQAFHENVERQLLERLEAARREIAGLQARLISQAPRGEDVGGLDG